MRIRAGVVLIEDDKVALIERFRRWKALFCLPWRWGGRGRIA